MWIEAYARKKGTLKESNSYINDNHLNCLIKLICSNKIIFLITCLSPDTHVNTVNKMNIS